MLHLHLLEDGGQEPAEIAREVAAFLGRARSTLDLALYSPAPVGGGGRARARGAGGGHRPRGARADVYNAGHRGPLPVPPPPAWSPELLAGLARHQLS